MPTQQAQKAFNNSASILLAQNAYSPASSLNGTSEGTAQIQDAFGLAMGQQLKNSGTGKTDE
jgi:hypothetical protein